MNKILFFGQLKERLDCDALSIELPLPCTVAEVKQLLSQRGERWQRYLSETSVLAAVNHNMSDDKTSINPGDEIAFFPPVTGG
ncbi:MoaD/ThiS family protein [Thalassotalea ganghwensis]